MIWKRSQTSSPQIPRTTPASSQWTCWQTVERLAVFPNSGRIVPELNDPGIREILFGNYRIVHRVTGDLVEILTVYHGARLLDPSRLR